MTGPKLRTARAGLRVADFRTIRVPEKTGDPLYSSPAWRKLMAEIFAERGRACQDAECRAPRAHGVRYGDHVVEIVDGGAQLDKANVLVRCSPCHGRKTAAARARRAGQRFDG